MKFSSSGFCREAVGDGGAGGRFLSSSSCSSSQLSLPPSSRCVSAVCLASPLPFCQTLSHSLLSASLLSFVLLLFFFDSLVSNFTFLQSCCRLLSFLLSQPSFSASFHPLLWTSLSPGHKDIPLFFCLSVFSCRDVTGRRRLLPPLPEAPPTCLQTGETGAEEAEAQKNQGEKILTSGLRKNPVFSEVTGQGDVSRTRAITNCELKAA